MVVIQLIVIPPPPDERPDDLVSAEYVARRFGCSVSSVYAGKCGTGGIKPVTRDPWRALREHVEAERAKFVAGGKASEVKGRISLVRRKRA
jgi:hypothetical protein